MLFVLTAMLACGPCPTGEVLCDDQCVPQSITTAEITEDVFSKSCAFSSCHSSAASASAGLSLHDEEAVQSMINRPAEQSPETMLVAPGDPENSYLIQKMKGFQIVEGTDSMPPGTTLCEGKIQLVEEWISGL